MRILLSTYGSRGDVEPLVALAVELQKLGAEAVVSAPPDQEFAELLARAGVSLAPAFMPIRRVAVQLMRDGRLVITRKGRPVDPDDFRGVYRLRLPGHDGADQD